MAEHISGGPGLEQMGRVEPNGVAHSPEIVMRTVNPSTRLRARLWLLTAVGAGAAGVTLALVFVGLHVVPGVSVAPTVADAAPVTAAAAPVLSGLPDVVRSPVPTANGPTSACASSLADAQSLARSDRWSDAAAKLETVRDHCDVVGPLYDAYLNQGRALADQERPAEAIGMFDKALQVKNGTEASTERALAVAYRDGRTALDAGDFDAAIDNLGRVQASRPDYGRGNTTLNLINAYLRKGDALLGQSQCADALSSFQRAQALKPNENAIVQRVSAAQQCSRPTVVPAPVIAPPGAQPVAADLAAATPSNFQALESTVRAYYDAINSRRFADAYSMLSTSARATQSLTSFAGRFAATRSIGLRYIDGTSANGSSAGLNAHTQTVTGGSAGLSTSCSRVVWVLIVENGQWKRDIRSESNNEFGEAC